MVHYKVSVKLCEGCYLYLVGADGESERSQFCVECLHSRNFYQRAEHERLRKQIIE